MMIVLSLSSSWLVSMEGIVPERERSRGMIRSGSGKGKIRCGEGEKKESE